MKGFPLVGGLLVVTLAGPLAAQQDTGFPLDMEIRAELAAADRERLGPPQGDKLAGDELAERTHAVAARMRCPSCQGLSVADSPTAASAAMRAKIERLLAEGYSQSQVLTYFEASYGEFIRLAPRPRGFNLIVWIAPAVTLLAGLALIAWRVRGARHSQRVAADLEHYRQRVRAESHR
ncbi:MAG: cytochrome c-type biogenesis protein [Thermoanaerobaculia bacterium]